MRCRNILHFFLLVFVVIVSLSLQNKIHHLISRFLVLNYFMLGRLFILLIMLGVHLRINLSFQLSTVFGIRF